MSRDDLQFVQIFIDEAIDMLDAWEQSLNIEDGETSDIDALFRCAHNLKGSSRSVGLDAFGEVVHRVEDLIQQVRSGQRQIDQAFLQVMLVSKGFLLSWVQKLRSNPAYVADPTALYAELKKSFDADTLQAKTTSEDAGFGFFDEEPSANASKDLGSILIKQGVVTPSQVEEAAKSQTRRLGEILIDQGAATKEQINEGLQAQKKLGVEPDETIRVSVKTLDQLMRMIGELNIQMSIARHSAAQKTDIHRIKCIEALDASEKLSREIRGGLLETRMQSLNGLFARLNKIATDVAKQLNKKVAVEFVGGETELDKIVIERVKDPLVHIIRNAVDHGIESESKRLAASKSQVGTIRVEAKQMTTCVEIHISDDGGGIPCKKVLAKAVERGLVSPTASLTDSEIHNLIFLPGFSTAEKITDVSGRGVGMDVVRNSVAELNGTVRILSEEGKGSRFIVSLPSSVAIIEALVVESAGRPALVPLTEIDEILVSNEVRIQTDSKGRRVMISRDTTSPLVNLDDAVNGQRATHHHHLGTNRDASMPPKSILVGASENGKVGFEIDRIVGQQTIVVRSLRSGMEKIRSYEGATILGSGMPCLIVNIKELSSQAVNFNQDEAGG